MLLNSTFCLQIQYTSGCLLSTFTRAYIIAILCISGSSSEYFRMRDEWICNIVLKIENSWHSGQFCHMKNNSYDVDNFFV